MLDLPPSFSRMKSSWTSFSCRLKEGGDGAAYWPLRGKCETHISAASSLLLFSFFFFFFFFWLMFHRVCSTLCTVAIYIDAAPEWNRERKLSYREGRDALHFFILFSPRIIYGAARDMTIKKREKRDGSSFSISVAKS